MTWLATFWTWLFCSVVTVSGPAQCQAFTPPPTAHAVSTDTPNSGPEDGDNDPKQGRPGDLIYVGF